MQPNTVKLSAAAFVNACGTLEVEAPDPVADAHDRLKAVTTGFAAHRMATDDELAAVLISVVEAGKTPAADPEVQRILASQTLASKHALGDQITAQLVDQFREACRTHVDELIEALAGPFDANAGRLAAAHRVLGDVSLDDTASIVARGGAAADAWGQARAAATNIDTARGAWVHLCTLLTGQVPGNEHRLLVIADVPANTWMEQNLAGAEPDPWAALVAGMPLSLPSIAGYRGRVDTVRGVTVQLVEPSSAA